MIDFWKTNIGIFRRWVKCYLQQSYDPGGAPDLFLWKRNNNKWFWIEVKSVNDSISQSQWKWFQQFITNVSNNVLIARILPHSVTCPYCGKTFPYYSEPGKTRCFYCHAEFLLKYNEPENTWDVKKL